MLLGMNNTPEKKEIKIGKDYGFVFGLDPENGQHMIYLGNDEWKGVNGGQVQVLKSRTTTIKVNNYINPSYKMDE